MIEKKKLASKTLSLRTKSYDSPSKSIYLFYKDEKKNKFMKSVALNHIYQRKSIKSKRVEPSCNLELSL